MVLTILDSSVAIDYLRGREPAGAAIDTLLADGADIVSSELVRFELLAGVQSEEEPAVERLLAALDWVPVTEDIARRAAAFARRYRRSHSGIDGIDYLIAATADLLDGSLLTRNIRHFPMFPGLQPPY